ncbi:MAG: hypothetical protein A3B66_02315 [Alphaproteobacteria bacterium RIFCSPHIGHO2_02_FULL_46_13]|nr:MAG: hypothetical protein A3B66_02315 [Alphaproteobacteria bacterium RIFCSPHIGHO2_02_FULL_46_13]
MIICSTYKNLHTTNTAFISQFKLRHKCFLQRQFYNVSEYEGLEYDQYDTPASVYLVATDENGHALGASRLTPLSHHSMLADLWPEMVDDQSIFTSQVAWEGTRFCIDHQLPPELRKKVKDELVLAYLEFGLITRIDKIIGIMPSLVLRHVFSALDVDVIKIGRPLQIDGKRIQAASMRITYEQLMRVRKKSGRYESILHYPRNSIENSFHFGSLSAETWSVDNRLVQAI